MNDHDKQSLLASEQSRLELPALVVAVCFGLAWVLLLIGAWVGWLR